MKTITKTFLMLFVSLVTLPLFGQSDLSIGNQNPETEIKTFVQKVDGAGNLLAAVQAADGGYVTASVIDSSNLLIRRITGSGKKRWERRLNFQADGGARINGIAQTTDRGFVLAGQVGCSNFFGCDGSLPSAAILVKLRPNGTVDWKKSLTVSDAGYDYRFVSVSPMSDGGVIAIGRRLMYEIDGRPRLFAARFSADGEIIWEKSFATLLDNIYEFHFVIHSTPIPDGGVIVAFFAPLSGVEVMKISNSGDVVWEKLVGLGFYFQSIGVTSDGGVILTETFPNSKKLRVVVLNADGTLRWKGAYRLRVPGNLYFVSSPIHTSDGGYVFTGSIYNKSVDKTYGFIAKIDQSRTVSFQNTFGSGQSREPVFATADGGLFLFGADTVQSDLLVSKVNSDGSVSNCGSFQAHGETKRTSFGRLRIRERPVTQPEDLSFEPLDLRLSSLVSNHRTSTVCQ